MIAFWRLPSAQLCMALLAAGLLVDAVLLPSTHVGLVDGTITGYVDVALFMVLLTALFGRISILAGAQTSGPHILVASASRKLHDMSAAFTLVTLHAPTTALLSYLAIAMAWPLQDNVFAAVDRALGFDWVATLTWVNGHPLAAQVLVFSYHASRSALMSGIVLLALLNKPAKMWDFLALMLLSLFITIGISGLVPAIAAYAYYLPAADLYRTLEVYEPNVGRTFLADLMALRADTLATFDPTHIRGLVTFPSYHTIMALGMVYAVWSIRYLRWVVAIFSALVVLSTLHVGGHYFVDLIGGAIVFAVSVAAIDKINGRLPFWANLRARLPSLGETVLP